MAIDTQILTEKLDALKLVVEQYNTDEASAEKERAEAITAEEKFAAVKTQLQQVIVEATELLAALQP